MENRISFARGRSHEIVSIGRLAVDLYSNQYGCNLEDVSSFAKYLGGSSGNVAFGCARLGLKSAIISRVGDEQMGRFLLKTLAAEGCDISQITVDPKRKTALAILGIKDRETYPLLFYRDDCADMAFCEGDVDETFIAKSMALHITGTHFSTERVRAGSLCALRHARAHDVRTILDIDYRPVLWGLTTPGDGETRYIPSRAVTLQLQDVLGWFDLIVGTTDEFIIAGGERDLIAALRVVRTKTPATLVVKLGPLGCAVIEGEIPEHIHQAFSVPSPKVDVSNLLGAGDGFLAGFLSGWLRGMDYAACCRRANASGALVVSRHACAPAMPTEEELQYFIQHMETITAPAKDSTLNWLHHVTPKRKAWRELFVLAFDHRSQLYDLARDVGASETALPRLKNLLVEMLLHSEKHLGLHACLGAVIDDHSGEYALHRATGRNWWLGRPIEHPESNPLVFELDRSVGAVLGHWPKEQVVKSVLFFEPMELNAPVNQRLAQESQLRALYDATNETGHNLLLELIPTQDAIDRISQGQRGERDELVLRTMTRVYNLGIYPDWWSVPPLSVAAWARADVLIKTRDPYCRGMLMLGMNASMAQLEAFFTNARQSQNCRGFLVGRTIFQDPARAWLDGTIDDACLIERCYANFERLILAWRGVKLPR